ncbi:MAG: hypothetical protein ACRD0H_14060, partial [Actinomycetes bacterium]
MIWLTWRQHRGEGLAGAALLLALAAGLVLLGASARSNVDHLGLSACLASGSDCSPALGRLHSDYHWLPPAAACLIGLPLLAGMFWGAPLVAREIEGGTHRFVWTQTVTRRRWISSEMALILGVAAVAAVGLGLLAAWAFQPLIPVFGNRFAGDWFDVQGVLPAAYTVFALALGALLGAMLRRTLLAMAVTLVAFGLIRLVVHDLRKSLLAAQVKTVNVPLGTMLQNELRGQDPLTGYGLGPGDWALKTTLLDPSGHPTTNITTDLVRTYCPGFNPTRGSNPVAHTCLATLSTVKMHAVYH